MLNRLWTTCNELNGIYLMVSNALLSARTVHSFQLHVTLTLMNQLKQKHFVAEALLKYKKEPYLTILASKRP